MARIEAVIHMAIEVGWAMKPRANADEPATVKPFRTVVAIGSASIGRGIVVTIGTSWFDSNSNAKADLRLCLGRTCRDEECGGSGERKKHIPIHDFSSQLLKPLSFSPTHLSLVNQNPLI
jgi:hypothetical protein